VKAAYRPLQGYVEPQLDSFGCQQLDRVCNFKNFSKKRKEKRKEERE